MTEPTPAMRQAARRFKNQMDDLGLGVTITTPGRAPVVITEPPDQKEAPMASAAVTQLHGEQLTPEDD